MKIRKSSKCPVVALVSLFTTLFISSAFSVSPPDYPDTLWIPVTFYDFHSDSSNPEFEIAPYNGASGLRTGMVAEMLDGNSKPVVGPRPYFNQRIDRWFRPWSAGDFSIFNYYDADSTYRRNRFQRYATLAAGTVALNHDTSFKNIVIHDSLPFLLINNATATYQYRDLTYFPLDGLGFGNEGRTHNYSFSMELHWKFTKIPGLTFSFTGDDDVWAFVGNKLRMDIGGIHDSITSSFNLDNETDLKDDSVYTLDFFYVERHVVGSSIKITTNIVSPIVRINLNTYPNDTICPYTKVELSAVVEDNVTGPRPDLARNVQWQVLNWDGQPTSSLQQVSGEKVNFVPRYAYSTVVLVGTVFDGKDSLRDTVTLVIEPCEPKCVFIEAGPVDITNINALRNPQELERISILNTAVTGQAFAIARDTSGAYVRLADSVTTTWRITPDGIGLASASAQANKKYLGIVTRIGVEGTTFAEAEEPGLCIDSVIVEIAPHYFVRLELRDSITGDPVDTIRLTTNDIGRYTVWGLKSTAADKPEDSTSWAITNATWNLQPDSIKVVIPPPQRAQSWKFDPKTPGTGTLTLTNPDDARTEALVVPVYITRSPPHRATIEIVSPGPHRAGDTIKAAVKIFNNDSLVPGLYCFGQSGDDPARSVYRDTLGTGGAGRPYPTLRVDGKDTLLNVQSGSIYSVNQCFSGGIDTINVVLFYAPFDPDSLHRLSVTLGGKMNARTEPFDVLPSFLDSIAIEDVDFNPIPPQTLTGTQSVTPYSVGYDQYGNRIDVIEASRWSTTGTLFPKDEQGPQTYVTAVGVPADQQGTVCASARKGGGATDSAKACLQVTIIGPKKAVTTAISRDLSGNGLLDAIEIRFDRTVSLSEITVSDFSNIFYTGVKFSPKELAQKDANTLVLHLSETDTNHSQTNWTPYFDITGTKTIAATQKITTVDGAGPVVWRAVKDNVSNTVKIELSERVINTNGSLMAFSDLPAAVFNVYRREDASDSTYKLLPTILDSIKGFKEIRGDSIFIFELTNNQDLSRSNYINLEAVLPLVQDGKNNKPNLNNIKRRFEIVGQQEEIKIAPNPAHATFVHTPAGSLTLRHDESHKQWAKQDEGVLIRVTITPDSAMSASLKIYDMAGNLVEYTYEQDFAQFLASECNCLGNNKDASKYVLDFYWNGSNHQGMKVAPGVYKVIFYLDYHNSALTDVKLAELLGIAK